MTVVPNGAPPSRLGDVAVFLDELDGPSVASAFACACVCACASFGVGAVRFGFRVEDLLLPPASPPPPLLPPPLGADGATRWPTSL
jgi:hypothetical protein